MEKLISWVEIPSIDFDRAVEFYSKLLNVELEKIDCGYEKMACLPQDSGAVIYHPDFKPSINGVIVNLNVGNRLEKTLDIIEKNGGKVLRPKTKIEAEGRAYFALFMDSEGNQLGLYGE